jgi:hypothetical protein
VESDSDEIISGTADQMRITRNYQIPKLLLRIAKSADRGTPVTQRGMSVVWKLMAKPRDQQHMPATFIRNANLLK